MLLTTTNHIDGRQVVEYKDVVFGEVIVGANAIRDMLASLTDIFGGRSGAYERKIAQAREEALQEMTQNAQALSANAILGVEVNYQSLGDKGMFMVLTAKQVS